MTVKTSYEPLIYKPGAGQVGKSIAFEFTDAAQIKVTQRAADGTETQLVQDFHYTIEGDGAGAAGLIRPQFDFTNDEQWIVERVTEPEQPADLRPDEGLAVEDIEGALDDQTRAQQERDAMLRRTVRVPVGEEGANLPSAAERAGKHLAFDVEGNPVASEGTGADAGLRGDLAAGGLMLIGTGTQNETLRERLSKLGLIPDGFGGKPDSLFQNPADGKWYSDSSFVTEATNNDAAMLAMRAEAEAGGRQCLLPGSYRIVEPFVVDSLALCGFNPGQENAPLYSALCIDHGLVGTRKTADNDWNNPGILIDNSADAIGGSRLEKFAVLGNLSWVFNKFDNRCPRAAIQGYYQVNGNMENLHIAGFEGPAISNVGPCQDRVISGWIHYCGKNDGGSETNYAIEHKPSKLALGGGAFNADRSPNAIHYYLHRINHCPAYILHDHGTSYLGEISYAGKLEHADWQHGATYGTEEPLVKLLEGGRQISFSRDMHMTIPRSSNKAGDAVWAIDIQSNRTRFSAHVRGGGNNTPKVLRMARAGAINRPVDAGGHVDAYFENMPTSTAGVEIHGATYDFTLHQDLQNVTGFTRNAFKYGRGSHGKVTVRPEGVPKETVAAGIIAQGVDLQYPASPTVTVTASAVGDANGATLTATAVAGTIFPKMSVMDSNYNIVALIVDDIDGNGGIGDYLLDITTGLAAGTYYIGYAGEASLDLNVEGYGGGIAEVNLLYGTSPGSWRDSQHLRVGEVHGPKKPRITAALPSNYLDLRKYGTGLIVADHSGLVIDGLNGGSIGQQVTIYAKQAFTLTHGSWFKLANEQNVTVAAGTMITLTMQEGRVAVESGRRSGAAVPDFAGSFSATPTQAEVQALADKVNEFIGSVRASGGIKT